MFFSENLESTPKIAPSFAEWAHFLRKEPSPPTGFHISVHSSMIHACSLHLFSSPKLRLEGCSEFCRQGQKDSAEAGLVAAASNVHFFPGLFLGNQISLIQSKVINEFSKWGEINDAGYRVCLQLHCHSDRPARFQKLIASCHVVSCMCVLQTKNHVLPPSGLSNVHHDKKPERRSNSVTVAQCEKQH